MKIKLSKNQWEEMGKKAGWMKTSIMANDHESLVETHDLKGTLDFLSKTVWRGIDLKLFDLIQLSNQIVQSPNGKYECSWDTRTPHIARINGKKIIFSE
jgi:hypothetical protein